MYTSALFSWVGKVRNKSAAFYLASFIVGLIIGFGAFLLKTLIGFVSHHLTANISDASNGYILLLLPVAGIVLAGVYQRYVIKTNISHGVEKLQASLKKKRYDLPTKLLYSPMIANILTLGFGGSAGAEGPIAYTGAAVGSNVGYRCGFSSRQVMLLIGCGAGAGIAGIFKAPIGGVLFSLEVLGMAMSTVSVIALVISCLTAALTAYACSGFTPDVDFSNHMPFEPGILVWALLLGVVCGLFSVYYTIVMRSVRQYLGKISCAWVKNMFAGISIGVCVFIFPSLYGEGYGVVSQIINNHYDAIAEQSLFHSELQLPGIFLIYCFGIMMCKAFVTSNTNSGGGVSGDFAPTLFAGAIVGLVFALGMNILFGLDLPVGDLAFVAMAGVMSGAVKAPLMAIFLVAEMTGVLDMLLPLAITSSVSYFVAANVRRMTRR